VIGVPGPTSAAVGEPAAVAQADETGTNETDSDETGTDETDSDETGADELDAERLAARTERVRGVLDELVEDGTITSEQADSVAAHMAEQAPDRGRHGPRGGHPGRFVDGTVLELLDIDAETLREALQGGATLAEVAEFSGVSTEELVDALVEKSTERLDEAVANGRLDDAEAAERAAELEERITERVTNPSPGPRGGLGGPGD
jgi:polyhydroxyalkanoate synthesis regulator phasin